MTIDQMLELLAIAKEKVGGDAELPVMNGGWGENDYILPSWLVIEDLKDQDGNEYRCALIGDSCGEELTKVGTAHFEWKWEKDAMGAEGPERTDD